MEQANQYLKGWEAYFNLCTRPCAKYWTSYDGHLRRRLRAIVIRQKKRARFLYRHLQACGVSKASAGKTAYSQKGIWAKANMQGMYRAYSNAWFAERLVSLWGLWRQRHPVELPSQPVSDGQLLLFAL
jgi:RNA-directed DNA polymerase